MPTPLSTPQIVDACIRTQTPFRMAPAGLVPVIPGAIISGPVRPVQHGGSVDIFFEALLDAQPGEVLVIDNQGRTDEACIGDLVVLETRFAGLKGIVLWGLHRDQEELEAIGFPVFSYGRLPSGPRRPVERAAEAFAWAHVGDFQVTPADTVFADSNGAIFVATDTLPVITPVAREIQAAEQAQAQRVGEGIPLREQFQVAAYLAQRQQEPSLTFREHLRRLRQAVEE
jgi:regulator of RNase E activity RraA